MWTYDAAPDSSTDNGRKDTVRLLVGDTDASEPQLQDEEIAFFLAESSNSVYGAASIACRSLAAKYARMVDVEVDQNGMNSKFSQMQKAYDALAIRFERESKKRSASGGLGVPAAGGIRLDETRAVEEDTNRVLPAFEITSPQWSPDD